MGACFETSWKVENAQALAIGETMRTGGYVLTLDKVGPVDGPNYDAERAIIRATRNGAPACTAEPERRVYPASAGQTTSQVAICMQGVSDLYIVLSDPRTRGDGTPSWLIRSYWNPWARFIFLGPILMALGGMISLSDRRLRFALPRAAVARVAGLVAEPAE
jgi:cytochrome c-type biogenesis protein CcmF